MRVWPPKLIGDSLLLSNTLFVSLDLTIPDLTLSLSLCPSLFLPRLRGRSCRVTGYCHGGGLSSSLTSTTLFTSCAHTHIHIRTNEKDEERQRAATLARPRRLEETTAYEDDPGVCVFRACAKNYICARRSPTKEETTASRTMTL